MAEPHRLESLDVLRTAAVALVIFDHWGVGYPDHAVGRRAVATGWVGVDLFFVLSGFLVSGLIIREHQHYGVVDARRFLIRRGLKIYPAFYVFLVVSVLFADQWLFGGNSLNVSPASDRFGWRVLADALFFQNYADGMWVHTWTLAVEEHFYLLLALYAGVASHRGWMPRNALRAVIGIAALGATVFVLRGMRAVFVDYEWKRWYAPSHVRIDSLLVGVGLSFLYHYERAALERFVARYRPALAVACGLLLLPVVVLERSRKLMYTFGLTSIALGFGLLILLMLTSDRVGATLRCRPWSALCVAGRHSYSVYLWHVPTIIVIGITLDRFAPATSMWIRLVIALLLSFAVGIVISRLVEVPALRLRDRIYPSRSGALTTLTPDTKEDPGHDDRQVPDRRSSRSPRALDPYDSLLGRDGGR